MGDLDVQYVVKKLKLIVSNMKIKVKLFNENCKFSINHKGDWIDLKSAETIRYKVPVADRLTQKNTVRKVNFDKIMVPLGIGMKLPKGYEAIIVPRSSSFKSFGFIQSNMIGIIDSTYNGPNDQWYLPIIPLKEGIIIAYDRVCQFRIQLSQKATIWQKIKWLFNNKIEFEFVNDYNGDNRGGFGSTGIK